MENEIEWKMENEMRVEASEEAMAGPGEVAWTRVLAVEED